MFWVHGRRKSILALNNATRMPRRLTPEMNLTTKPGVAHFLTTLLYLETVNSQHKFTKLCVKNSKYVKKIYSQLKWKQLRNFFFSLSQAVLHVFHQHCSLGLHKKIIRKFCIKLFLLLKNDLLAWWILRVEKLQSCWVLIRFWLNTCEL